MRFKRKQMSSYYQTIVNFNRNVVKFKRSPSHLTDYMEKQKKSLREALNDF